MRKSYLWLTLAVALTFSAELPGQSDTTGYMHGRCYKAHPGKGGQLREFFDTVGRTLGEEAVKAGKLAAYSVIEARVPRGRDAMCDFIATSMYAGYPTDLQLMTDAAQKRLKMEPGQIGEKLNAAGYLLRSTLSRVVGSVGTGKEGAIVSVLTFHTPSASAYEDMVEAEIQTLAQSRADAGAILGWGTAVVVEPRGTNQDFNASAYTVYEDMAAQGKRPDWVSLYAKTSPGKSWDNFLDRLRETRELMDTGIYVARVSVRAD